MDAVLDVAVVGAGYAGLSAARKLSDEGRSTVVLEGSHNPKVAGSNPAPLLAKGPRTEGPWCHALMLEVGARGNLAIAGRKRLSCPSSAFTVRTSRSPRAGS
jgi:cation diffusion facilitator CzcD-associated flavoprotein CzcO